MDVTDDSYEREAATVLLALTAFEEHASSLGISRASAARARRAVRRGLGPGASADIDPAHLMRHLEEDLGSVEASALVTSIAVLVRRGYWEWYIPLVHIAQVGDEPSPERPAPDLASRIQALAKEVPLSDEEYEFEFPLVDDADRTAAAWFEFGPGVTFRQAVKQHRIRKVLRAVRAEFEPRDVAAFEAWVNEAARIRRALWPAQFVVPDTL